MKKNASLFGLALGLIMPFLGLVIFYFIFFKTNTFSAYMDVFFSNSKEAPKLLSLAILFNLIPFLYYNSKRLDMTVRGVVVATMLYAVLIILMKFAW